MYRVQKILSMLGISSRRECEKLILQKKIKINNQIAILGSKIKENDSVSVNGKLYIIDRKLFNKNIRVILYNKLVGEIVTHKDTHKRKTVFKNLPKVDSKLINIGRLDMNTSGLLLFTNNGELAHRLMHPSYNNLRKYHVTISSELNKSELSKMKRGVKIGENEIGNFLNIKKLKGNYKSSYEVTLNRGRYREVRRIFKGLGHMVKKLKRIKYSSVCLGNLKLGKFKELTKKGVNDLMKEVNYT
ncbi:MAG: pseudouridine synthase [Pseudomonadota bacterium]|nr:pseudouridine synthase [Pseudomonadota bacterium]